MKVRELKRWLEKMEQEGAEELNVVVEGKFGDKVKLEAVEPSGIVAESIMLIS